LLELRGIVGKDDIEKFLNPKYEDLVDPFLFRDMEKAAQRLEKAKNEEEKVFIYGDYDSDGVCSCAILCEVFREIGLKDFETYIPHREKEGYGLNIEAIDYIKSKGASLIVACDCGTSNSKEANYAKSLGIDLIIMDHHEEPKEPARDVVAFLNPHISGETYPFKYLSAAGVVFKAACAFWKHFGLAQSKEKWLLDIVAIATITDMMKLVGENRIIVKYGLIVLNKTKRLGLQALVNSMGKAGSEIGSYEIGFMIGPRLNAAGRLDHANTSFELLESNNPSAAFELASEINQTNSSRQSETERILKEADEKVKNFSDKDFVLVAFGENWSPGVVGLVSGKITEKYNRPSLVVTKSEKGFVGSGRSIEGFNITKALESCKNRLIRFGGHEGACGFTIKTEADIFGLKDDLNAIAKKILSQEDLKKNLNIDMELRFSEINMDLACDLEKMSPFGMGNPCPKFASFGTRIENFSFVGGGKHLKMTLSQEDSSFGAIAFGAQGEKFENLSQGDLIDVVYEISINSWNSKKEIQLKIIDIKKQ